MIFRSLCLWLLAVFTAAGLCACGDHPAPAERISGSMEQRAYVWQRLWRDAVAASVREHGPAFTGLTVLGAQLSWTGETEQPPVRPDIHWKSLTNSRSVSAAIRLEGPLPGDPATVVAAVIREATRLLAAAKDQGVELSVVQLDYDSPQRRLGEYRAWLHDVRAALHPLALRITTLASWLAEPEFAALITECDGYILQVHSFDPPAPGERPAVCDPVKARAWVEQAGRLGRPFAVALPTYRTTAGHEVSGRKLGVATDGIDPAWPPGTVRQEFPSDPAMLAGLVAEWTASRPAAMSGIYWYRLPVPGDVRNWTWPALASVMSGEPPRSHLAVKFTGGALRDAVLCNSGDQDEWIPETITLTWTGPAPAAGDGTGLWQFRAEAGRALFTTRTGRLLPAGATTALGWLRFHEDLSPDSDIVTDLSAPAANASGDR